MVTEKIYVNSLGEGREDALNETLQFAESAGMAGKESLRLRLLTEETLGMLNAITEDFDASFWLERDGEGPVYLHLDAETEMDFEKKQELINASTLHRNAAAKGFMGKVRNLFENAVYYTNMVGMADTGSGISPTITSMPGMYDVESANILNSYVCLWSMSQYREDLDAAREEDPAVEEAWDELEKSIVASIASEVQVGIRGDKVELVIEKK